MRQTQDMPDLMQRNGIEIAFKVSAGAGRPEPLRDVEA